MAYRNLFIEGEAILSYKNEQLLINTESIHSVPIEDINSIILDNNKSSLTVGTLSKLTENGVTIYFCNNKHLPCGVLLPFASHSRCSGMLKLQEALTIPTKKQLWQQIVKAKINNQATCLSLLGKDDFGAHLQYLAKTVNSGDTNNVEATAANYYFKHLFRDDFKRGTECDYRNNALNYGYTIIRGHIARLLVNYGFVPMLGLHHRSELNAFNLADDFIEPFRPLVDLFVATTLKKVTPMTPLLKHDLHNLLNMDIKSSNQRHSVSYAAERMIQSFTRCCQNNTKELLLPKLVALRQHTYE